MNRNSPTGADTDGRIILDIRDNIEASRWELHDLGIARDDEAWQALDAAERAYNDRDIQTAGCLLAHAGSLIGKLSASAPASLARRAKGRKLDRLVMSRWRQAGGRHPSRRAFALKFVSEQTDHPSERTILRILQRNLGNGTRHPGRPPVK